jgi:hypothetical protein
VLFRSLGNWYPGWNFTQMKDNSGINTNNIFETPYIKTDTDDAVQVAESQLEAVPVNNTDWVKHPTSSGKFNLSSLPAPQGNNPLWMTGIQAKLDNQRTASGQKPDWIKGTLSYLDRRKGAWA